MTDFFKFETVKEDIPFYNGEPKLSKPAWAILILGLIVYFLIIRDIIYFEDGFTFAIVSSLALFIPFLLAFRGHYSRFFKRLHKRDIKPIIVYTVLSLIYSILVGLTLGLIGIKALGFDTIVHLLMMARLLIQLFGEELYKIIILIVLMAVFYRFSKDRKRTIIIASILTMIIFGACHEGDTGSLLKVILVQGFGSVFDLMLYFKTKNVWASYVSHLLFDCLLELMMMV